MDTVALLVFLFFVGCLIASVIDHKGCLDDQPHRPVDSDES